MPFSFGMAGAGARGGSAVAAPAASGSRLLKAVYAAYRDTTIHTQVGFSEASPSFIGAGRLELIAGDECLSVSNGILVAGAGVRVIEINTQEDWSGLGNTYLSLKVVKDGTHIGSISSSMQNFDGFFAAGFFPVSEGSQVKLAMVSNPSKSIPSRAVPVATIKVYA